MNMQPSIDDMLKRVIHPCDAWARGAKHENWQSALVAMNDGAVLAGPMPSVGAKSVLGITMFIDAVKAANLHAYLTDYGLVYLGLKENFSPALLSMQEREREASQLWSK
ncbi:hypothetical protein [Paucibacter soli]|uniref:hypothetical protein n=1 Tax=Paucibacter soli TaxID=3133433 RepID=UPI0030B11436